MCRERSLPRRWGRGAAPGPVRRRRDGRACGPPPPRHCLGELSAAPSRTPFPEGGAERPGGMVGQAPSRTPLLPGWVTGR